MTVVLTNRIGLWLGLPSPILSRLHGDKVEDRSFVFENGKVLFEYDKLDRLERERFYAMGSSDLLAINDLGRSKGSGLFVWSLGEKNPRAAAGADG